MQSLEERLICYSFFFFINTKSGNKQGGRLLSFSKEDLIKNLRPHNGVELYLINIFDHKSLLENVKILKQSLSDQNTIVRIIICGGDGTIGRMLNELNSYQIKLHQCVFGVLPIGSGNDFCRSLGWPAESFDCTKESFIKRLKQWMDSPVQKYDVWEADVQVQKNGKIQDIRDRKEYILPEKSFKKIFINYLGVGLDARVTYFSERIRTSSAFFNKILYGIIGTFNYLIPMKELKKKIEKISNHSSDAGDKSHLLSDDSAELQMQADYIKQGRTPLSPNEEVKIHVKKKYRGFVCLNSTSCMAGVRDSWKTKKIAVTSNLPQKIWTPQSHGDGKVEFLAYKNQLSLALERCMRMGGRVMQGSGPFEIIFSKNNEGEQTYIQIDGQSMKITNLKSIKISRASKIQSHQINVMIKEQ